MEDLEILTQVWHFQGSRKPMKKCAMKNETEELELLEKIMRILVMCNSDNILIYRDMKFHIVI